MADADTAGDVIGGRPTPRLSPCEGALGGLARKVVDDPNATTDADFERLRDAGRGDREIFEATAFVTFRLAFSTVNDALGTSPFRP